MDIVDIPLLDIGDVDDRNLGKEAVLRHSLVFAGRLLSHLSSPYYLCELFNEISKQYDYKLTFYSQGDCEKLVKGYSVATKGKIEYNGFVPHDELIEIYKKTDILVSIGSKRPDMLPSKIFEYMAMGEKFCI